MTSVGCDQSHQLKAGYPAPTPPRYRAFPVLQSLPSQHFSSGSYETSPLRTNVTDSIASLSPLQPHTSLQTCQLDSFLRLQQLRSAHRNGDSEFQTIEPISPISLLRALDTRRASCGHRRPLTAPSPSLCAYIPLDTDEHTPPTDSRVGTRHSQSAGTHPTDALSIDRHTAAVTDASGIW